MLSLGTELRLAFCTASYNVGLAVTSGPPLRAATSTFLISLATALPRLASYDRLLVLRGSPLGVAAHERSLTVFNKDVAAHEPSLTMSIKMWPLMSAPSHVDKDLVHAVVLVSSG